MRDLLITWISMLCMFIAPTKFVKAPAVRYPSPGVAQKVVHDTKKWTVLISGEGWEGWERGTGVLIDPTHVLTCEHVASMEGQDRTFVYFYPGYLLSQAKEIYSDYGKDLAILELDVPVNADGYARFTTRHYDGEPITVIGNAEGSMQWFVTYGIISGEGKRDLYTDGQVYAGDSGGPWVDNKGRIVALTDWGLNTLAKGQRISGGIATHTINDFLKDYHKFHDKPTKKVVVSIKVVKP